MWVSVHTPSPAPVLGAGQEAARPRAVHALSTQTWVRSIVPQGKEPGISRVTPDPRYGRDTYKMSPVPENRKVKKGNKELNKERKKPTVVEEQQRGQLKGLPVAKAGTSSITK